MPSTEHGTHSASQQSAQAANRFGIGSGNVSKVDSNEVEWRSYTELDDVDDGVQKRGGNSAVESQEYILAPHGGNSNGRITKTVDVTMTSERIGR